MGTGERWKVIRNGKRRDAWAGALRSTSLFSSLSTADILPARSSEASQPQGSQHSQDFCWKLLSGLGRGSIKAVRPTH